MEKLFLYNTLGHKLQEFIPIDENCVRMYSCGPTVYSRAHIGNMRAYIFADTLKRVLSYIGYNVKHVMNITDVGHLTSDANDGEDKLAKAARETNQTAWEVSKIWTEQFFADIKALNILPVATACKATEHIAEQIALVKKLEEKGFTYITSDGVYYDTTKFANYADLAQIDIEGLQAGKRIEIGEKKNKTDFALWKFSNPNEKRDMEWDSPWGKGFPGWHIECSAMSMKYLGESFDIHTGGVDHVPIHHTNEIAQSEGATGKKFVNYWLHSEFLVMSGAQKISKSLGNVVDLDTLRNNGISPLAYRYLCLNTHYRKQLLYGMEILQGANNGFKNLTSAVVKIKSTNPKIVDLGDLSENAKNYLNQFKSAICNDLNVPQAMAVMWTMIKDNDLSADEKYTLLLDFDKVFGLNIADMQEEKTEQEVPAEILQLLDLRNKYRSEKEWGKADEVRQQITDLGYKIVDTKEGSFAEKI